MAFITPITDRTSTDVDYAILHPESTSYLKGAFNYSDLNRIKNNTEYLRDLLISYGYDISFSDISDFAESDFPYVTSVMNTIRGNILLLVDAFYTIDNPPIVLNNICSYETLNNEEINIEILEQLLQGMIDALHYCGDRFYSGDVISL